MKTVKAWALTNGLGRIAHFSAFDGEGLYVFSTKRAAETAAMRYGQSKRRVIRVEIKPVAAKRRKS